MAKTKSCSTSRSYRSRYFADSLYSRMAEDLHLGGMSQRTHDMTATCGRSGNWPTTAARRQTRSAKLSSDATSCSSRTRTPCAA